MYTRDPDRTGICNALFSTSFCGLHNRVFYALRRHVYRSFLLQMSYGLFKLVYPISHKYFSFDFFMDYRIFLRRLQILQNFVL